MCTTLTALYLFVKYTRKPSASKRIGTGEYTHMVLLQYCFSFAEKTWHLENSFTPEYLSGITSPDSWFSYRKERILPFNPEFLEDCNLWNRVGYVSLTGLTGYRVWPDIVMSHIGVYRNDVGNQILSLWTPCYKYGDTQVEIQVHLLFLTNQQLHDRHARIHVIQICVTIICFYSKSVTRLIKFEREENVVSTVILPLCPLYHIQTVQPLSQFHNQV